jgi:hypothetical protein
LDVRHSRRLLTLAAAVPTAVLVPALGGAHGDERVAPQLQPPASLPAVQTPAVTTPDVPAVQTPSVPATPATPVVPGVQTPPVQTPDVPAAQAPSAPSVRTPAVGGGSDSSSSGRGGDSSSAGADAGASGGAGTGASGGGGAEDASGSSTKAGTRGGAARRVSAARRERTAKRRRAARERRFRARVEQLEGCFGSLSSDEERVLSLRAGLGGEAPRTVAQVAGELGIAGSEVRATQRRALRRLRGAARSSRCGAAGGSAGAARTIVSLQVPRLQPAVVLTTAQSLVPAERLRDRNAVRGVEESGGNPDKPTARSPAPTGSPGVVRGARNLAVASGGTDVPVIPLALAATLALIVLAQLAARHQRDDMVASTAPPMAQAPGSRVAAPSSPPAAAPAPEPSPGDTGSGPEPAAAVAASTAAGATSEDDDRESGPDAAAPQTAPERETTVVRRRSGGLVGAVTQGLRGLARRTRGPGR